MADESETPPDTEELGPLGELLTHVVTRLLAYGKAGSITIHNHFYGYVGNVMTEKSNTSTITVSGSNRGGTITVVQDAENVRIKNNIDSLREHNQGKTVADAFEEIQNTVNSTAELDDKTKKELLQSISALSEQATKDKEDRPSWSISGPLGYLQSTLSTIGTLSALWDKWGDVISSFFDIS